MPSRSNINFNVPITEIQLNTLIETLDEALLFRRDFSFSWENETYEIPHDILANADWRYQFQEKRASQMYRLDLSLKAGISVFSFKRRLTFDAFKTLVHQLTLALKNGQDLQCRLKNRDLQIPFSILHVEDSRFEYEYEQKSNGKTQVELEFHIHLRRLAL